MSQLMSIDLGTSSVKVVILEASGKVISSGAADYPIHQPQPSMADQDPSEWWQATQAAVRQAIDGTGKPMDVKAIGLSGQMHGTVLLDKRNRLLSHAIIWPDQRSEAQVNEITEKIGKEKLIRLTGSPLVTGFQAASALWVRQERPEIWKQVNKILLPKDYIRWRLTGQFHTDPSDASATLLFDTNKRQWSPLLMETAGIDPEMLPPIKPSVSVAGELTTEASAALGLKKGMPVVIGAGDTPCSLVGSGVLYPEDILLTISTGGQLIKPTFEAEVDTAGRIHTFCTALEPGDDQPGWYKLGGTLAAGLALSWLKDNVFSLKGKDPFKQMTGWAEKVPPGAGGLTFLPYLIGERTPYMDPHARAIFLGLTLRHGQAEMVRAVMEGVTFACYEAFSIVSETGPSLERIILAGGGARSRLWQQIVADIFGVPVLPLRVTEQSGIGAALIAGAGTGIFELCEMVRGWADYNPPVEPSLENHKFYQEKISIFRDAYVKHKDDFRKL